MATGFDPGGHHFVVLSVSINNTAIFVSAVVTYDNHSPFWEYTFKMSMHEDTHERIYVHEDRCKIWQLDYLQMEDSTNVMT